MKIILGKLGEVEAKIPESLATCMDFSMIWGSDLDRSQQSRLCASAISLCTNHKKLPFYNEMGGEPLKAGHKILDRLLEHKVPPQEIFRIGGDLLVAMSKRLDFTEEVDQTENFISQKEEG